MLVPVSVKPGAISLNLFNFLLPLTGRLSQLAGRGVEAARAGGNGFSLVEEPLSAVELKLALSSVSSMEASSKGDLSLPIGDEE